MTDTDLIGEFADVARRHYRFQADHDGVPQPAYLADLVRVAELHATQAVGEAIAALRPATDATGHPVRPDGTVIPESPEAVERRAARTRGTRKTTTR